MTEWELKAVFLNMTHQYESCALVGSSGIFVERPQGEAIDKHDAVFRINYQPAGNMPDQDSYKFSAHMVGSFTTLKYIGRSWHVCLPYGNTTQNPHYSHLLNFQPHEVIHDVHMFCRHSYAPLHWLTDQTWVDEAYVNELGDSFGDRTLLPWEEEYKQTIRRLAEAVTGLPNYHLSTGIEAVFATMRMCRKTVIYGFYPLCRGIEGTPLPHHFFDRGIVRNCDVGQTFDGWHTFSQEARAIVKLRDEGYLEDFVL
jgi:alpha-N-acetyl-neuraminate alpha-2,8-sialyltransferase (sialyltransferase 8F)